MNEPAGARRFKPLENGGCDRNWFSQFIGRIYCEVDWCTGGLVYWWIGVLVDWCTGGLVYWWIGELVDWCTGGLVVSVG
ncbi:hypothetical protein O3M35_000607 [Rhynocoris fuscipes]|uniref:Transmembrane protein n=1 Tax=Rhynocoris fuscipes TaxID=488301 RepID=A0AAW1DQT6_9HEMI